tara:strand:- start:241 stop:480 length:240 start_codon:yes stop_codon:yes gene_type:complete
VKDSDKPNNETLALKQLKSIKFALWTLVTMFVILPVIAGIGTGLVIGFMALTSGVEQPPDEHTGWATESVEMDDYNPGK